MLCIKVKHMDMVSVNKISFVRFDRPHCAQVQNVLSRVALKKTMQNLSFVSAFFGSLYWAFLRAIFASQNEQTTKIGLISKPWTAILPS